jgi:hypothetical protein
MFRIEIDSVFSVMIKPVPPFFREPRKKTVRRAFIPDEDVLLVQLMSQCPSMNWKDVASRLCGRTARQCRERWTNYLRPNICIDPWSDREDNLLLRQIEQNGHHWTAIAQAFQGRSTNDVKNRWHTHLRFCVRISPDGRFEIMKDAEGNTMHCKRKRKRNRVSANEVALEVLAQQRPKVVLPRLWSSDFEALVIRRADARQKGGTEEEQ